MSDADLIIIGAGPAGMAAASTAARGGLRVLLLDEQPRAGGQIYRDVIFNASRKSYLGKDYTKGRALVDALNLPNIRQEFGAVVWKITPGSRVVWSQNGVSQVSTAPHILIAGGAQERPTPFPGWTLPGVMSAGAAQVLMKSAGLLPRDAILTGSGPLLYLVAAQMIDAGASPKALVETQSLSTLAKASRHLPRALFAAPTLIKGLGLLLKIKRAGVQRFTGASGFNARPSARGNLSFTFRSGNKTHTLDTSLLLTHQGVVPSTHMSRTSGVEHIWNDVQKAYQPLTDGWGGTNIPGLHIVGDGAGIGGADAARAAGHLAAYDILCRLSKMSKNQRNFKAIWSRIALIRAMAIRPFLDAAYAPSPELADPLDETIICRCEEVSAKAIRQSYHEGALGPRQVKTSTRAGMGPCQGRMCDLTIQGILTSCGAKAQPPRARTPIKPVKLGELAALAANKEVK